MLADNACFCQLMRALGIPIARASQYETCGHTISENLSMSLTVGLEVTINHLRFGQDMDSIELRARGGEVKQHYAEEACRPR